MDAKIRRRFERFVDRQEGGCWLWKGFVNERGYGKIRIGRRKLRAHRVSWELHRGPVPPGLGVCHDCDVPACVNPDHLFLGTQQQNLEDMAKKGRGASGIRAKLTARQVLEIRHLVGTGLSHASTAKRFGVHENTVWSIVTRRTWGWLVDQKDFPVQPVAVNSRLTGPSEGA